MRVIDWIGASVLLIDTIAIVLIWRATALNARGLERFMQDTSAKIRQMRNRIFHN